MENTKRDMYYKMKVDITDPNTKEGMFSGLVFNLDCHFLYNEDDYGNGYYVSISGNEGFKQYIDIRYDKTFRSSFAEKWLLEWAYSYLSGTNGAWKIRTIEINDCNDIEKTFEKKDEPYITEDM